MLGSKSSLQTQWTSYLRSLRSRDEVLGVVGGLGFVEVNDDLGLSWKRATKDDIRDLGDRTINHPLLISVLYVRHGA